MRVRVPPVLSELDGRTVGAYHVRVTNSKMEALARQLVASPHWRWIPGMRTHTGARCLASARADGRCFWAISDGQTAWVGGITDTPDLTDPATLGCLLHLVREAWGRQMSTHFDGFTWAVFDEELSEVCGADTEAEALVAALLAAPEAA